MPARRHCASCGRSRKDYDFSQNQWRKPVGVSRCIDCVTRSGGKAPDNRVTQTARRNNATKATVPRDALDHPFAEGGFRWVARGRYTKGERKGELCVCKWFKTGCVTDEVFFDKDIKAMNKALDIIKEWNSRNYIGKTIKLNIPAVWTFLSNSGPYAGTKALVEPFIDNYQKFNSNSGWVDDSTPWRKVMQALSHFSYHASGGQFVLCDLQGGIYSNAVALTDPVILSRDKRFGVTDLGPKGISNFFSSHKCNEYCSSKWSSPVDKSRYFQPQYGTSMMRGGTNNLLSVGRRPILEFC